MWGEEAVVQGAEAGEGPSEAARARALERRGRRVAREAWIQARLGSHGAAAGLSASALSILGRAQAAWAGIGQEGRASKVGRAAEAHRASMVKSEAVAAQGRWRRWGRGAARAVPLLVIQALWIDAAVETWPAPSSAGGWLALGAGVSLAASIGGLRRGWRPETLAGLSAAGLMAGLLASFVAAPTLGAGGASAAGMEPAQVAHAAHLAGLSLPVLYGLRWWPAWLWGPLLVLAIWCGLPFGLGLYEGLPIEDLPLQVAFWSRWPWWGQPLAGMVFFFAPLALLLVLGTTAWHVLAGARVPEAGDSGAPGRGEGEP